MQRVQTLLTEPSLEIIIPLVGYD